MKKRHNKYNVIHEKYECSGGNNKEGADEADRVTTPANQGDAFEEDPGDMEVGIFIKNLSKVSIFHEKKSPFVQI